MGMPLVMLMKRTQQQQQVGGFIFRLYQNFLYKIDPDSDGSSGVTSYNFDSGIGLTSVTSNNNLVFDGQNMWFLATSGGYTFLVSFNIINSVFNKIQLPISGTSSFLVFDGNYVWTVLSGKVYGFNMSFNSPIFINYNIPSSINRIYQLVYSEGHIYMLGRCRRTEISSIAWFLALFRFNESTSSYTEYPTYQLGADFPGTNSNITLAFAGLGGNIYFNDFANGDNTSHFSFIDKNTLTASTAGGSIGATFIRYPSSSFNFSGFDGKNNFTTISSISTPSNSFILRKTPSNIYSQSITHSTGPIFYYNQYLYVFWTSGFFKYLINTPIDSTGISLTLVNTFSSSGIGTMFGHSFYVLPYQYLI